MKKISILFLVLTSLILGSCTKNFEDMNTDKKNPSKVDAAFLFSNAEKELMDQISSTNVNLNVWKLFSQYWTETTYTDEANYDIVNRTIPDNTFRTYYVYVLKPLEEAKALVGKQELVGAETEVTRQNKIDIINILEIYVYHNLVNIFGDVPYTEAVSTEFPNPKYDDAATIYADLLDRLDTISNHLVANDMSFGGADIFYGGDVAAWKKFANSLRLKIAINLADVDDATAKSNVEAAVTAGVFTSGADNALFTYLGNTPNTNPLYEDLVLSGRKDFVPANTIMDLMESLSDPRMDYYFQDKIDGEWAPGIYGASNAYSNSSHINDAIQTANFPGILMTYSEVEFYIAEAAARGYNVGQTAEEAYKAAVTASFDFWGVPGAADYLESVPYDANNWKESIGNQAYIAFYTRGFVAYNEYRRLDFPVMNVAPDAVTGGPVPTRFTYPINEQTLNADSYYDAAAAIGGDDLLTKLFWDKY
ncbi:MAG TPA: SusD/RagB family nutrient-binding outer membrane lipoprotein [Bacteroidales bacterium]|nr:SusD/RagB family nutrient-binding outer membrane lipoprotein [Bacteroidales bacterium]